MVGMNRKITESKMNRMIELRKKGYTYRQIMDDTGVSKSSCIQYLQNIRVEKSAIEIEWRKAEEEAYNILTKNGFSHIVNLNEICPSPYWDYYAEKESKRFLIDVTINQGKNLINKALQRIGGYEHIVLLKVKGDWKFIEINVEERPAKF